MNEPEKKGALVSLQDRINQITNQLNSAGILIEKAQTELLGIREQLSRGDVAKTVTKK